MISTVLYVREGDKAVNIDDVYNLYFQDIYRFLLSLCREHHTAEDLVQDTFYRAHLYLESYDDGNVKSWLFTVAHHAFIDHYRKQKRLVIKEESFFSKFFDHKKNVDDHVVLGEQLDQVMEMLEDLPENHKMAVILRDFHDFTYKEAAELMNVPLANFKVLLFRGRQTLRRRKTEDER